jgi:Rad3-related DNA helicase
MMTKQINKIQRETQIPDLIFDVPDKPSGLNLSPTYFPTWREGQEDIIKQISEWYMSPARFLFLEAPTGWGKSLIAGAVHQALSIQIPNYHGIVTTTTLALQEQYTDTTLEGLAASAWGRANYPCLIEDTSADLAPCNFGFDKCVHRATDCPYYKARNTAHDAPIAVLNTAFYLNSVNYAKLSDDLIEKYKETPSWTPTTRFGDAHLVIHDEAHLLENAVRSMVEIKLSRQFFAQMNLPEFPKSVQYGTWQDYIDLVSPPIAKRANAYRTMVRNILNNPDAARPQDRDRLGQQAHLVERALKRIYYELLPSRPLITMDQYSAVFRPVWGATFAEPVLFSQAKKHILMSATIPYPDYLAEAMGISRYEMDYISLPSKFHPMRRRIIYDPVIRMNKDTTNADMLKLVHKMDDYIDQHPGEKGIIHCVSFARGELVQKMSRHRDKMILHTRGKGKKEFAIKKYLASKGGVILISPSVGVGEDFGRDDNCRFQVFVKYPIPSLGDPVIKARTEDNPKSLWYEADMAFIQALGRGMRSANDHCVNYLLDAGAGWRLSQLPQDIQDSVIRVKGDN